VEGMGWDEIGAEAGVKRRWRQMETARTDGGGSPANGSGRRVRRGGRSSQRLGDKPLHRREVFGWGRRRALWFAVEGDLRRRAPRWSALSSTRCGGCGVGRAIGSCEGCDQISGLGTSRSTGGRFSDGGGEGLYGSRLKVICRGEPAVERVVLNALWRVRSWTGDRILRGVRSSQRLGVKPLHPRQVFGKAQTSGLGTSRSTADGLLRP